jgi:hypothetical protein
MNLNATTDRERLTLKRILETSDSNDTVVALLVKIIADDVKVAIRTVHIIWYQCTMHPALLLLQMNEDSIKD